MGTSKKRVVEITEGVQGNGAEAPDVDVVKTAVPPLRYFEVEARGKPVEVVPSHMVHVDQGILCFVTFRWSEYANSHVSLLSRMIRSWEDCKEVTITVPESVAVN